MADLPAGAHERRDWQSYDALLRAVEGLVRVDPDPLEGFPAPGVALEDVYLVALDVLGHDARGLPVAQRFEFLSSDLGDYLAWRRERDAAALEQTHYPGPAVELQRLVARADFDEQHSEWSSTDWLRRQLAAYPWLRADYMRAALRMVCWPAADRRRVHDPLDEALALLGLPGLAPVAEEPGAPPAPGRAAPTEGDSRPRNRAESAASEGAGPGPRPLDWRKVLGRDDHLGRDGQ